MTLCANCGKRPGTENWIASGGALAYVHGFVERWCRVCCVEAQLSHARVCAAQIPALERELVEAVRVTPEEVRRIALDEGP